MQKDLATRSVKVTNSQLRHHNSLLRKNLRVVISCSADNEKSQEKVDEMEDLIFASTSLKPMLDDLLIQGKRIFKIDVITICLDPVFKEYYPEEYKGSGNSIFLGSDNIIFADMKGLAPLFGDIAEPVIRGGLRRGAEEFFPGELGRKIRSEAIVPMQWNNELAGVAGFGSSISGRFHEGQGARFLKRLSRALSMKMELFRTVGPEVEKVEI